MKILNFKMMIGNFFIPKIILGLLCVYPFHFAQANTTTGLSPDRSHAHITIDTCLVERWKFEKIDANTFQPELYCRDIEDMTGKVFRFSSHSGDYVNRATKIQMEKNPRYAPNAIFSVGARTYAGHTFPLKFSPEYLYPYSIRGELEIIRLEYLMTLKEWEAENGVVPWIDLNNLNKAKQPSKQEPQRKREVADFMDGYMGKPITSVPINTQPIKFKAYKGYELWRWEKSYKNAGGKSERKCNQELYINSKGIVAGWWSNCPKSSFDLGTVPKSKPIPEPKPREITNEALLSRTSE